jgi:hypothetical protein
MNLQLTPVVQYDLHGQWDYGNKWSDPGCPEGGCLRSHINFTETYNTLSMITKAGIPTNKIAVGVASYGRSYKMTDPSCTGPDCTFTGPDSGAEIGECTRTAGYISNAELEDIITKRGLTADEDSTSGSNILIWDGNWAAFMNDENKLVRSTYYQILNFAGTSDWAVDLQGPLGSVPDAATDLTTTITLSATEVDNNQVCGLTWSTIHTTPTANDFAVIASSWNQSGADAYLASFLKNSTDSWVAAFFLQTMRSCSAPVNKGVDVDCSNFITSQGACSIESHANCTDWCPPEAMFVGLSIEHFHNAWWTLYQDLIDLAVPDLATAISTVSSLFSPPDTSVSTVFAILSGILGSMAAVGTFVSDFDLTTIGAGADAIAAISSMISSTQLNPPDAADEPQALKDMLGAVLQSIFNQGNATIVKVLDPGPNANITQVTSVFVDGAFLDPMIVDYTLNLMVKTFNYTLVCTRSFFFHLGFSTRSLGHRTADTQQSQYFVISAMQSNAQTFHGNAGYAFLYDGNNRYPTEANCKNLGYNGMIWHDNVRTRIPPPFILSPRPLPSLVKTNPVPSQLCMGFGRFSYALAGYDQNSEYVLATTFLANSVTDEMTPYGINVTKAIINNYECYKNPTTNDLPAFGTFSKTADATDYAHCFFNLEAFPITPANE